jgi:hypothetical protein
MNAIYKELNVLAEKTEKDLEFKCQSIKLMNKHDRIQYKTTKESLVSKIQESRINLLAFYLIKTIEKGVEAGSVTAKRLNKSHIEELGKQF